MYKPRRLRRAASLVLVAAAVSYGDVVIVSAADPPRPLFDVRTLDGSANNARHPNWGQAGTQYARNAPAAYADGVGAMVAGPNVRTVSNRVFNDVGTNLFSERGL